MMAEFSNIINRHIDHKQSECPCQIRTVCAGEKINIAEMLKDLGFTSEFLGSQGYMRLMHPSLFIDFLVPDQGSGHDKPYDLSALGINAQRLRFMELLAEETIPVKFYDIDITIPHPVMFALHKLLICERRTGAHKKDKALRDKQVAIQILNSMIKAKEIAPIRGLFRSFHKNRQKEIIKVLESEKEIAIIDVLKEE